MNATYPTVEEQMKLEQARRSEAWRKEADKIIAAYPEKHRDYHAMVLRHAYERGMFETNCAIKSLMAIKELIIKGEYSDERVLELINEGLQSMNALEKLKHIDKGMTNIIQWDAVSGDLLRQMCAWHKQLKLAIHELESERVAEPSNDNSSDPAQ